MADKNENMYKKKNAVSRDNRPQFPKRAVVTGGMPYGNKTLHFGHVGGVFVFADVYARFLRDRIGKDNVIFVSGLLRLTHCGGLPKGLRAGLRGRYKGLCEPQSRGSEKDPCGL